MACMRFNRKRKKTQRVKLLKEIRELVLVGNENLINFLLNLNYESH
jgi:hypothetical protein